MRVRLCKTSVALHWNLISSFINLISTHINLDQPYINFYQPCINLYQYKPTLSPGCTCVLFTSAICDTNRRCRCMVQHCEQGFKYRVTRVGSWYDQSDHNPQDQHGDAPRDNDRQHGQAPKTISFLVTAGPRWAASRLRPACHTASGRLKYTTSPYDSSAAAGIIMMAGYHGNGCGDDDTESCSRRRRRRKSRSASL